MKRRSRLIPELTQKAGFIAGVFGIGDVIWVLLAIPFNALTLIFAPIPISIYILSLVAGVALWRDNSFGRKASIVVQAIQLPKIVSPLIIFTFSFGFDIWVHILFTSEFSKLGFEFRSLADNEFFFNVQDAPISLGVSITACIFLAMLLRHRPGKTEEAAILPPPPPMAVSFRWASVKFIEKNCTRTPKAHSHARDAGGLVGD